MSKCFSPVMVSRSSVKNVPSKRTPEPGRIHCFNRLKLRGTLWGGLEQGCGGENQKGPLSLYKK